ncbi:uncharacterized protein [Drosophila takahashii]|uniref:uncharacterized protein n=1 Tax=Drosophila takahashii TaxID=29030 RepID=UPI001CF90ABB|nr:uncharacterized protein LOC108056444 [Drosophila takahashii]
MPVLKLATFYTQFFPSERVRCRELKRRRQLMRLLEERKLEIENQAQPKCPKEPANFELQSKHVIGSFQLRFERDPLSERLEITATLPSPRLPPETEPEPQDELLYELYVCSSQGRLLARIPFLESDYRRAAHRAINCMSI